MRRCSDEFPSASLSLLILQLTQLVTSTLLALDKLPAALCLLSCVSCLGLTLLKDTSMKLTTFIFIFLNLPAMPAHVSAPASAPRLFWAQDGAQAWLAQSDGRKHTCTVSP